MNYDFVNVGSLLLPYLMGEDEYGVKVSFNAEEIGENFIEYLKTTGICVDASAMESVIQNIIGQQYNHLIFEWFLQTDLFQDIFVVLNRINIFLKDYDVKLLGMATVSVFRNTSLCLYPRGLRVYFSWDQLTAFSWLDNFVHLHQIVKLGLCGDYKCIHELIHLCGNYSIKYCARVELAGDAEHANADKAYKCKKLSSLKEFYEHVGFIDIGGIDPDRVSMIRLCDDDKFASPESSRIKDQAVADFEWRQIDKLLAKQNAIKAF